MQFQKSKPRPWFSHHPNDKAQVIEIHVPRGMSDADVLEQLKLAVARVEEHIANPPQFGPVQPTQREGGE